MENPKKPKNAFLKFLPKATSSVYFQNPTYSPGRDHHHNNHHSSTKLKTHAHKGFSGPLNFSSLPFEARQKPKNGGYDNSQEPTSPKVSCMGQITCKHKKKNFVNTSKTHVDDEQSNLKSKEVNKKSGSKFSKLFSKRSSKPEQTAHGLQAITHDNNKVRKGGTTQDNVNNKIKGMPSLGNMRKFASGRETLSNFDWSAQIAPIDNDRDCFSDDERRRESDDNEDDYEKSEVIIPFSAPILLCGEINKLNLEPRKEINLWKRRTMHPPPPLALHS